MSYLLYNFHLIFLLPTSSKKNENFVHFSVIKHCWRKYSMKRDINTIFAPLGNSFNIVYTTKYVYGQYYNYKTWGLAVWATRVDSKHCGFLLSVRKENSIIHQPSHCQTQARPVNRFPLTTVIVFFYCVFR